MSEKKDLANIARIDQEPKPPKKTGQHGWWVRFRRRGQKFYHFFNDNKYDGKEKCLEAAILFRDAVKTQYLEDPNTERLIAGSNKASRRNTSGVVGVNRSEHQYTKRGKKYDRVVWQAHWPIGNGKYKNKAFSIKKHGEIEAFQLALKAREEGLATLESTKHPTLIPPINANQKVWRYMDFTKFISMLEEGAIFFSCVAMLNDPFEGSFSKINKLIRPLMYKDKDQDPSEVSNLALKLRNQVAVNCWHSNDFESAAMWELYSKSEEAICIQSTYQKLSTALVNKAEIGTVKYVDYNEEYIPEHDPYLAFLYKRKSFEHESEIRAIIKDLGVDYYGNGKAIKVDLDYLIENIYVSPNSPKWFNRLVMQTIKTYKLKKNIIQSSLADDPVY